MGTSDSGSALDQAEPVDASRTFPIPFEGDRSRSHLRVWTVVLATAVVAGLVSWLSGEVAHGLFKPRLFRVELMDKTTSLQPTLQSQKAADAKNAALAFGIQGGILALAMGFAGGMANRSTARGLVVGLGGQAAGALAGVLSTLTLFPLLYRDYVPDPNDMLTPIFVQAGIWMAIGAVGGLALAIGLRSDRHPTAAIVGAVVAALLAAFLYHLLNGVFSPDLGLTTLVASTSLGRLTAAFSVMVLVAAGAARGALGRIHRPVSSGPAQ